MRFERKLNKIGQNSLTMTIPADLAKYLELTENDTIVIDENNKVVTLYKKVEQAEAQTTLIDLPNTPENQQE